MVEQKLWIFVGLMTAVAAAIPFVVRRMQRHAEAQTERAFESVNAVGHVVEDVLGEKGRRHLRIWGTLSHPVAIDLRISCRRGLLARFGGSSGLLDPLFEQSFRVVSRERDRVRLIVDPEIQQRLAHLGRLEFRLGSFHSLLPPEYGRLEETRSGSRLRRLWMIRVPNRRGRSLPTEELVEVGRLLAQRVAKHCLAPGTPDLSDFETGRAEGQWL